MLSKRSKIIILIIAGLLTIVLLIWFLMKPQVSTIRGGLNVNAPSLPTAGTNIVPVANINQAPPVVLEPEADLAVTLKSLASAFSERYGSFSNQSDFKNLRDLSPMMTDRFAVQNDVYIKSQKEKGEDARVYYGVTSKTVKNRLVSLNEQETEAVVEMTMQRREARESMNSNVRIFYQDIVIGLVKERGEWKIGSAEWQN
jgi:hypothetical protein